MARYRVIWAEIPAASYAALPAPARAQIDRRLEELAEDPHGRDRGGYDARSDRWTTVYGAGAGVLVYALVDEHQALIVLRLV